MNKLRRLAISIVEEVEEHIDRCNNSEDEPKNPFSEENWYLIEDNINDKLIDYLVGDDE
jgi:hypothetical protein